MATNAVPQAPNTADTDWPAIYEAASHAFWACWECSIALRDLAAAYPPVCGDADLEGARAAAMRARDVASRVHGISGRALEAAGWGFAAVDGRLELVKREAHSEAGGQP